MSQETDNGRTFEWAVAKSFENCTQFPIELNNYGELALKAFETNDIKIQQEFLASAQVAVELIMTKEKKFFTSSKNSKIVFNSDHSGAKGDVRDLILHNSGISLGISCKNNHFGMKHSRLSGKIDFIKKWGIDENGCSTEYWNAIRPVFNELQNLKNQLLEWKQIDRDDKANKYFLPVLKAWEDEILSQHALNQDISKKIVKYLLGNFDFYKIIRIRKNAVKIQGLNLNNSLQIPRVNYPTKIINIEDKPNTLATKVIYFDNGFQLSFRLHSAETRVIPSLKFDVTAIGWPEKLYQHDLTVQNYN